ncbi:MAG: chorismate mutase [Alphaproteobacteria bacterium]|nr:chorismate mutase [Alphaproteobacteria bacterium]MCK5519375.1 chorismate mutase [Alphaproteobacteria bacterium]MCK5555430.1 chorismate mutase [Alphaproteobacteria bacterium]MCK5658723.1 chorismate mutase [Alphaproteobacteria bacterium]
MKESDQESTAKLLKSCRDQIDDLDTQIMKLLGARFRVVKKVAKIKSKYDISSFLHGRAVKVRNRCINAGKKYGMAPAFVYSLYSAIIYESCAIEDEIKEKLKKK